MLFTKRPLQDVRRISSYKYTRKVLLTLQLFFVFVLAYVWIDSYASVLQNSKEQLDKRYLIVGSVTSKEEFVTKETKHVNPHSYNFMISEKDKCKDDVVKLVIAVLVKYDKFSTRQAIRNAWGSVVFQEQQVRLIFIVGKSNSRTVQDKIVNESATFRDIVQEDFMDSYMNLTLKSVAMLRWVSLFCRQAAYVLKLDDDVFLNVKLLLKDLTFRKYKRSIVGRGVFNNAPIRDKGSKFYTTPEEYNKTRYPDYGSGAAYVISGDIVEELFTASLDIPFFKWEDVFVGGICRLAINATFTHNPKLECVIPRARACQYSTFMCGYVNYKNMTKLWEELQTDDTTCL